jgi:ankyrin repeat protein
MENESLLWLAALHGSLRLVLLYIDVHECDVNSVGSDGFTPLLVSCYKGHMDVIKLLLARGADIEMPSEDGLYTPLFAAATQGRMAVVKLLLGKVVCVCECSIVYATRRQRMCGHSIPNCTLLSLTHAHTRARARTQSHRAHAPPLPPLPHSLTLSPFFLQVRVLS